MRAAARWLGPLVLILLLRAERGAAAHQESPTQPAPSRAGRVRINPPQGKVQIPALKMPALLGLTPDEARGRPDVQKYHLLLEVREQTLDGPLAPAKMGTILRQSVEPGTLVNPGASVTVWIVKAKPPTPPASGDGPAGGRRGRRAPPETRTPPFESLPEPGGRRVPPIDERVPYTIVPDVLNRTWSEAVIILKEQSLSTRPAPNRHDNDLRVVDQKPAAGSRARAGDVVSLRFEQTEREPPPPRLAMPRLVGRQYTQAVNDGDVRRLELKLAPQDDERAPGSPGTIVAQSVNEGAQVKLGAFVQLRVATGVRVPNVVHTPLGRGRQRLDADGLRSVVEDGARATDATLVAAQVPEAGTLVARGATVRLRVVDEPPPIPTAAMPQLVGRAYAKAVGDGDVRQLELRLVRQDDPQAFGTPGAIVDQSIAAGAQIKRGATVTTRIATGVQIPLVVKSSVAIARQRLAAAGFQMHVDGAGGNDVGDTVIAQSPDAGIVAPRGAAVRIWLAARQTPTPTPTQPTPTQPTPTPTTPTPTTPTPTRPTPTRPTPTQPTPTQPTPTQPTPTQPTPTQPTPPTPPPRERTPDPPTSTPTPATIFMPRLVGRAYKQAVGDRDVRDLQLTIQRQEDPLATSAPGTIVRQSIAPGTPIAPGATVVTAVASGVIVPAVTRTSIESARQRVAQAGLQPRIDPRTMPGEVGIVLDQTPSAGEVVARGAAVSLAIVATVAVPDVQRRTRGAADDILTAQGLRAQFEADAASDLAPGLVSAQDPAPSALAAVGATVRLQVATGVSVPRLTGAPIADARSRASEAGLRLDERDKQTSLIAPQTVAEQDPQPGMRVARGAVVTLAIAVPETVSVPDLADQPRDAAVSLLTGARLRASVTDDEVSTLAPGRVSGQDPAAGAILAVGNVVRVRIAAGVVVPNLTEATRDAARDRLEGVGLTPEFRVDVVDRGRGLVVGQEPSVGSRVARGSPVIVRIEVSNGVLVPRLVGRARDDAFAALAALGLEGASRDEVSERPEGLVIRQSMTAGTRVGVGTTVSLVVASRAVQTETATPPTTTPPATTEPTPVSITDRLLARIELGPWLPLAFAVGLTGLVVFRIVRANHTPPSPPPPPTSGAQPDILDWTPAAAPPPVHFTLEPRAERGQIRLEVIGRSLVDLEIGLRVVRDAGEPLLEAGPRLVGEERRLYE